MKKIKISSEVVYIVSIFVLAFAVAVLSTAGFGVSMVVAPAYMLSQKITFLTFGQAEYVIQAIIFIFLCIIMKKVKPIYLVSFLTCVLYGAVLDLYRLIPFFNQNITPPESINIWLRIFLFVIGEILTAFSVALSLKTYIYSQLYDFFVKTVSQKFNIKLSVFKTCFDMSCLLVGVVMTLLFFKRFVGIGVGTVIMAFVNGALIGAFANLFDKYFEPVFVFKKFSKRFEV